MTTRRCMANGNKSKSGIGRLGMLTLPRCWHWLTISFILSMLTQHHGNGFAGKRRAWLRYGTPSTGYIGEKRRPMCGMIQCWGSSEVLAMQLALNSARLLRKGLLWLPYCSWSTLVLSALLHGDASIWIGCHLWQLGRKMLRVVLFL